MAEECSQDITLRWRQTYPDSPLIGMALDGDTPVGSLRQSKGGPDDGTWYWSLTACPNDIGAWRVQNTTSGSFDTKDDAKAALGRSYVKLVTECPGSRERWAEHCRELEARMARRDARKAGVED